MALKIICAIALFSSIIFLDLVFFFPAFVVILFILNSIEKDLKSNERAHVVRYEQKKSGILLRDKRSVNQEIHV